MMTAFLTLVSIYHEHYRPYLGVSCPDPVEVSDGPPGGEGAKPATD